VWSVKQVLIIQRNPERQTGARVCSYSRPGGETEADLRVDRDERHCRRIECVLPYGVAPPDEVDTSLGVDDGEEHDDDAERDASVEGSGEDVVVAHPPAEVEATHKPLEDERDGEPGREVDPGRGRHRARAVEEHGHVHVTPDGVRVAACEEVEGDRADGAEQEEVYERVVATKNGKSMLVVCRKKGTYRAPWEKRR
jgi:hypothetical protein